MRFLTKISLTICSLFVLNGVYAQDESEKQKVIEQRIELISETAENENIDLNTVLDNLFYYFDHPINLNSKTAIEKLQDIGLLTEIQINNLNTHIINHGKLLSVFELQAVPGFTINEIKLILPFIEVNSDLYTPNISLKEVNKEGTHEIINRWTRVAEEQQGFNEKTDSAKLASPNSYYLGSPDKYYVRYRFKYLNNISFGITAEKDAGEQFFNGTQKSFDFYSAHFYLKNFNKFKAIALGDFQAQFGQGLTLWSGLAFGKSIEITSVKRNAQGLKPYASVDESRFMRGAGVSYELGKFTVTAIASHKKIDANILVPDTLTINDNDVIASSFQQTGFHRTNGELEDKHLLTETHLAGNIGYDTRSFHFGVTGLQSKYSGTLQRNPSNYNQFDFNGNQNSVFGADYNWVHQNLNLFGESAYSINGGMAHVHGALISLDPKLTLSTLFRKYDRDFQNLLGNGFGESSTSRNEQGILIGFDLKLTRALTFNGYFDQYQFEWLRYQTDKPRTNGFDVIGQLFYKPNKKLSMYARYRFKNKPINSDAENIENIVSIFYETKETYRFNVDIKASESIKFRSRVEFLNYERIGGAPEDGFMAFQDVHYSPKGKPYSFKLRYALFDTDSYSSKIYAYENDLLYLFSVPAMYNRGSRYYIIFRYKFARRFDLWLRYSRTVYENQDEISSGLNGIIGNTRTDLKAQLIIKL